MPNREADQHGTVSQIPKNLIKNRAIVSVIRNPYSKFLSAYEFRWWAKHPPENLMIIKKKLPEFPNLSIDDYVELSKLAAANRLKYLTNTIMDSNIGNQTIHFIQMFFDKPDEVLKNINDNYIDSGEYKKNLKPIIFLRQENLNFDLINLLSKYNFSEKDLRIIENHDKVNVTLGKTMNSNDLWTYKSINYIMEADRYLFKILNDLGIEYYPPIL